MKGSLVPRHRQYAPLHKHMTSGGECGLFEEEKSMWPSNVRAKLASVSELNFVTNI
jgi:hypothetical protein